MARGLCCNIQAQGLLGNSVRINVRNARTGNITQRCGVCEIVPSCQDPQKAVFRFRFLPGSDCGLATSKCTPSPAGQAQYAGAIQSSGGINPATGYFGGPSGAGVNIVPFPTIGGALPATGIPYRLPNP